MLNHLLGLFVQMVGPKPESGRLRRRVTSKSEAGVSTQPCSQAPRPSPLGNQYINQEREMSRGIDMGKSVEDEGSLQLIRVFLINYCHPW